MSFIDNSSSGSSSSKILTMPEEFRTPMSQDDHQSYVLLHLNRWRHLVRNLLFMSTKWAEASHECNLFSICQQ